MIRGLYTSALSMATQMNKMDVISNNIANVDTTGFKKDTVITQSFTEEYMKRVNDPKYTVFNYPEEIGQMSLGVFVQNVHTDFSTGALKKTDEKLDLAISGNGFFDVAVTDPEGNPTTQYTRDGSFVLSNDRVLMTKDGYKVLGKDGPITIPDGDFSIDDTGKITVAGAVVGQIQVTDFENTDSLRKMGNNLYATTAESTAVPATGQVLSGYLEASNVTPVREMVDMIALSRLYEANQRVITVHDSTLGRAVNDIARK